MIDSTDHKPGYIEKYLFQTAAFLPFIIEYLEFRPVSWFLLTLNLTFNFDNTFVWIFVGLSFSLLDVYQTIYKTTRFVVIPNISLVQSMIRHIILAFFLCLAGPFLFFVNLYLSQNFGQILLQIWLTQISFHFIYNMQFIKKRI